MPPGCYIGVRVGDVLKQGRYEPQRCYHFPMVDRRRNAKIDIYQHVGSCNVAIDPEIKSIHEVSITNNDGFPGMRLKVNVQSKGGEAAKSTREARTKQMKTQAKDYLCKHGIEERLSMAVKALLKEQPADPTEFLCRHLRGDPMDMHKSSPKALSSPRPPAQLAGKQDLDGLRSQACDVLSKACNNGDLTKVLLEAKEEVVGSQDPDVIRQQALNVLCEASADGRLNEALSDTKAEVAGGNKQATSRDLDALRQQACGVLFKASGDGQLNKVLCEIKDEVKKPTQDFDHFRQQACDILFKACASGELNDVLSTIKAEAGDYHPSPQVSENMVRPSDGHDFAQSPPAMMLPTMDIMGPDFASLGMMSTPIFI